MVELHSIFFCGSESGSYAGHPAGCCSEGLITDRPLREIGLWEREAHQLQVFLRCTVGNRSSYRVKFPIKKARCHFFVIYEPDLHQDSGNIALAQDDQIRTFVPPRF